MHIIIHAQIYFYIDKIKIALLKYQKVVLI